VQPVPTQAAGPPITQGFGGAQPPFVPQARDYGGAQQAVGQVVQSGVVPMSPAQPVVAAVGGAQKEQLISPTNPEKVPLVELHEGEKIPEEVEGWMEKLEQAGEIKIPDAIKKDEQVILDNAVPTRVQDTVVLPLSQSGAAVAAKKKVSDSAKWLYVWCVRLIKMLGERAKWGKEGGQV
jgi:hypothetical protein